MKASLKKSVTIWLSGIGITGVMAAVAMGEMDIVVGGLAALMFGAQAFLRRAIGDEKETAVSEAMKALAGVLVKYRTSDGLVPMSKIVEMIQLADPKMNPFQEVDGAP